MDIQEAKEKVCEAGKLLLKEGLVARTWGNVSIKINDKQMVITPSGRKYDELTPDEMVLVDIYTEVRRQIKTIFRIEVAL